MAIMSIALVHDWTVSGSKLFEYPRPRLPWEISPPIRQLEVNCFKKVASSSFPLDSCTSAVTLTTILTSSIPIDLSRILVCLVVQPFDHLGEGRLNAPDDFWRSTWYLALWPFSWIGSMWALPDRSHCPSIKKANRPLESLPGTAICKCGWKSGQGAVEDAMWHCLLPVLTSGLARSVGVSPLACPRAV